MADLKDALLKSGLIDRRTTEDMKRAERAQKKRKGKVSVHREQERIRLQRQQEEEELKEEERRRQRDLQGASAGDSLQRIIAAGVVRPSPGNRRFYFVDREGRIPFLELGDPSIRGLSGGELAIIEARGEGENEYALVTGETAVVLQTMDPAVIRFWNKRTDRRS